MRRGFFCSLRKLLSVVNFYKGHLRHQPTTLFGLREAIEDGEREVGLQPLAVLPDSLKVLFLQL